MDAREGPTADELLAEWRAAERRANSLEPGTAERAAALDACEAARDAYHSLIAERADDARHLARLGPSQG